uniref:Uncharacterized protein n=1 Tax=Globodera rostochiensis TaxID=31243 RepID=A0A914HYY9_GLORO
MVDLSGESFDLHPSFNDSIWPAQVVYKCPNQRGEQTPIGNNEIVNSAIESRMQNNIYVKEIEEIVNSAIEGKMNQYFKICRIYEKYEPHLRSNGRQKGRRCLYAPFHARYLTARLLHNYSAANWFRFIQFIYYRQDGIGISQLEDHPVLPVLMLHRL